MFKNLQKLKKKKKTRTFAEQYRINVITSEQ